MKTLVREDSQNTITIKRCGPELYYGAQVSAAQRGFLVRQRYNSGGFNVLSINLVSNANGWGGEWEKAKTLEEALGYMMDAQYEVFVFDTFKELANWLTGDVKIG